MDGALERMCLCFVCLSSIHLKKEKKTPSFPPPNSYDTRGEVTDPKGGIRYAAYVIAECVFVGGWVGGDTNADEGIQEIHDL